MGSKQSIPFYPYILIEISCVHHSCSIHMAIPQVCYLHHMIIAPMFFLDKFVLVMQWPFDGTDIRGQVKSDIAARERLLLAKDHDILHQFRTLHRRHAALSRPCKHDVQSKMSELPELYTHVPIIFPHRSTPMRTSSNVMIWLETTFSSLVGNE